VDCDGTNGVLVILPGVGIVHPVLQQVQRNTKGKAKFSVEAEFLETKEVFANVFGKVTTHKLLTAIIEGTSTILADVVHGRAEQLCIVRSHAVVHTR
jgi:hypothetical protein